MAEENDLPSNTDSGESEFSPEIVKQFLETQQQKLVVDAKNLALKEKDLEYQSQFAENLLEKQHDLLKGKPKQDRLTIITWGSVIFLILIAFAAFVLILLNMGKDSLVNLILLWIGRIVALIVTFVLGRMSANRSRREAEENPVEVLED